ncbi:MAG TPA: hypothetical protein VFW58_11370, partial [Trichococcus sp.]|nr:hypothetical protein [Trichococcus sp.]
MNTKEERYREEFEKWYFSEVNIPSSYVTKDEIRRSSLQYHDSLRAFISGRKAGEEDLNNSINFHCPHFLTNDSGTVSCHHDKDKQISQLKAENERLNNRIKAHESGKEYYLSENQKLKNLVERAKPYINRSYFSDDMP